MKPKRIAISVGHGYRKISGNDQGCDYECDPGAVNKKIGITEFEAVGLIKNALRSMLKFTSIEVVNIPPATLQERIRIIRAEHRRAFIELAIEIHLNSFRDKRVNGSEVWHCTGDEEGRLASLHFLEGFKKTLSFRNRGVKKSINLAFLRVLRDQGPVAILTEAAFISNHEVATDLKKGILIQKIAWAHALGIWSFVEGIEMANSVEALLETGGTT